MAGTVNSVFLVGRLGAKPDLKYLPSGKAVCEMRLATDGGNKDKPQTEWHRVVCWEKTAESSAKYLEKGRLVCVEGRLQTRSYEKNGEKRYVTEIVAQRVTFLGDKTKPQESRSDDGYREVEFDVTDEDTL